MKIIIDETENGYTVTLRKSLFYGSETFVFETKEKMLEFLRSRTK
jgi:hypothetical protein